MNRHTVRQTLKEKLLEESGANQLAVLAICLCSLLIVPVLFDFSSVQYARRVSQTGSDAAVMAAAKDYAIPLSRSWTGFCGEPSVSVVGRYATYVQGIGWSPLGSGSAMSYAQSNNAALTSYTNYFNGESKYVSGVPIPFIEVYVETEKEVGTLIDYNTRFETPAEATSVVYLDRYTHRRIPCGFFGSSTIHIYEFFWKISLTN